MDATQRAELRRLKTVEHEAWKVHEAAKTEYQAAYEKACNTYTIGMMVRGVGAGVLDLGPGKVVETQRSLVWVEVQTSGKVFGGNIVKRGERYAFGPLEIEPVPEQVQHA